MCMVCFVYICTGSSGDKSHQSSVISSGSQQIPAHSSASNCLSSAYDRDKSEPKEPGSKYGKKFNNASSGRQYQVFCFIVLSAVLLNDGSCLPCDLSMWLTACIRRLPC